MLDSLPHRQLICGFLSGKKEILNWEPSDLLQFYHDTLSIQGSLDELLPQIDRAAVNRAIKIGACWTCSLRRHQRSGASSIHTCI